MAFRVIDLDAWYVLSEESEGANQKLWLIEQRGDDAAQSWLWKPAGRRRVGDGDDLRPWITDHFSERIVCELARLIRLPAATVELGRRDGIDGSMSSSIIPEGWSRVAGDVLLSSIPGYVSLRAQEDVRTGRIVRCGYSLENVAQVLGGFGGPPDSVCEDWSAFDVFAGYLVLDAWVANSDRHAENWLALSGEQGEQRLGSTFDHGTALGSGIRDADYDRQTTGIERWCARGKARTFEGKPGLVELAWAARDLGGSAVAEWFAALAAVERQQWLDILAEVGGLSVPAATFCDRLLQVNQERLAQ